MEENSTGNNPAMKRRLEHVVNTNESVQRAIVEDTIARLEKQGLFFSITGHPIIIAQRVGKLPIEFLIAVGGIYRIAFYEDEQLIVASDWQKCPGQKIFGLYHIGLHF